MADTGAGAGANDITATDAFTDVRVIPRVLRPKPKKGVQWVDVQVLPGAENAVSVYVKREDRSHHPWTGQGYSKKYALTVLEGGIGGEFYQRRQGLRLWMAAGGTYYFDASNVPKQHPFYFTRSATGGTDAPAKDRKSPDANKGGLELLVFKPTKLLSIGDLYYQCSKHAKMGGETRIYQPLTRAVLLVDDRTAIMQHTDGPSAGHFFVETWSEGQNEETYDSLESAVAAVGLSIHAHKRVGTTIAPNEHGLIMAHIGEDSESCDIHSPAIMLRSDGTPYCSHVNTLGDLHMWLAHERMDVASELCPECARIE